MRPLITVIAACAASLSSSVQAAPLAYPPSPKGDVVDVYDGVAVADPYRGLEDLDSPQTRQWVEAQNALTLPFLAALPERKGFAERLSALWNYERYEVPEKVGDRYFFGRNDGLQNQSVLYVQQGNGKLRVLLDPNTLSTDGTVALAQIKPSHDGRWLLYSTAVAGSDWNEFRIRDVDTGADQPDVLTRIKFSDAQWTQDNAGFFYSRYPALEKADATSNQAVFDGLANQKIYYHASARRKPKTSSYSNGRPSRNGSSAAS